MQWLKSNDRGSSAVVVALFMIVIVAVAALAIDVGAMHATRQQLQTGADAGALAIAQDCARVDCSAAEATAQSMADTNVHSDSANGAVATLEEHAGMVRVETDALREHWFAPIIGIESTPIHATAAARWGYPTGGTAVLPLTFSSCALAAQAGFEFTTDPITHEVIDVVIPNSSTELTVLFSKKAEDSCTGPSGNVMPGGFGWLDPDQGGSCDPTTSVIDGWVGSDTGNDVPCSDAYLQKWIGKTVLLPVFKDYDKDKGQHGEYKILGYAAFTLTGYKLSGNVEHPAGNPPCNGSERCIRGSFSRFADLSEDFDFSPSGPNLGAAVVALTE